MSWIGVVTNAGAALLEQWAAGSQELNIDGAAVGTGTVAVTDLRSQTALYNQKDTASILSSERVAEGTRFRVQVLAHATAGYTANQIGIFASLGSGASTLLALYQDETGVTVPTAAESPDYAFSLHALVAMDNTGSLTVNVDTSALVTQAAVDAHYGLSTDGTTLISSLPFTAADGLVVTGGRDNVLDENGDKIIPRTSYVYSHRISASYQYNSPYKFLDLTVEKAGFYLITSYLGSYSFPDRNEYSATTLSVIRAGETNSTQFGFHQYMTTGTITFQNTTALEYFNVGDKIIGSFTRTWYNNTSTVSISGYVYVARLP